MSNKLRGVMVVILGLTVTLTLAGLGSVPVAGAKEKPPPPPKPAKPLGPKSGINFDTWGPAATDDVVLKWDEQTLAEQVCQVANDADRHGKLKGKRLTDAVDALNTLGGTWQLAP